jgi:hypothetical protein
MSDDVLIRLKLEAEKAIADAKALDEQIKQITTDEKVGAEIRKRLMAEAAAAAKQLAETQKKAATASASAEKVAAAQRKKDLKELADLRKDLDRGNAESASALENLPNLFAKAFGGGEFAEKLRDAREGASAGDKLKAVGTGTLFAVQALAVLWQRLGQAAVEFTQLAATGGHAGVEFKRFGDATETLSHALVRGAMVLKQFGSDLGLAATYLVQSGAEALGLGRAFAWLADRVADADDALEDYIHAHGGLTAAERDAQKETGQLGAVTGTAIDYVQKATKSTSEYATVLQQTAQALHEFKLAQASTAFTVGEGEEAVDGIVRRYQAARDQILAARRERAQNRTLRAQLAREPGLHASRSELSGAGLGEDPDLTEIYRELRGVRGQELLRTGDLSEIDGRRRGESTERYLRREIETRKQLIDVVRAQAEAEAALRVALEEGEQALRDAAKAREAEVSNAAREGALARAGKSKAFALVGEGKAADSAEALKNKQAEFLRANDAVLQFGEVFGHVTELTETRAQAMARVAGGAFQTLTGAFKAHVGAFLEGRESIAQALQGILHETLLALAQEAAVKTLFETAQGFAALASYQYPQAAAHFTSAGIFAAVTAAAGAGAALTTPAQAGAGAGASGAPRESARAGGGSANDNGSNRPIIVNYVVNGSVFNREAATDEVAHHMRRAVERGLIAA